MFVEPSTAKSAVKMIFVPPGDKTGSEMEVELGAVNTENDTGFDPSELTSPMLCD
jgi:hypothetical protein